MWILYALLSAGFAGAVAIFGKIGIKNIDGTLATTVRAIIMTVFLLATSALMHKFPLIKTIDSKALLFITLSGLAGAISWIFYILALKYGPASGVAAVDRLSIVFVVVLAALFLGEAMTIKSAMGLILIVGGALLLVFK